MAESKTEKMRKLFASKALDVEQMDDVAGGTRHQTADDSRFLNVLLQGHPAQCDRHGEAKMNYDVAGNTSRNKEIRAAWKACGVDLAYIGSGNNHNIYIVNGKEVTQSQAMKHAMNVMGKQLQKSDWYWPD